jgi:hypothetical protein
MNISLDERYCRANLRKANTSSDCCPNDAEVLREALIDVLRFVPARAHPGHMSLGNGVDP